MPINDTLDTQNVALIYHGILCNHKKEWVPVLYRDMDEAGSHHSQQTKTETENQILRILSYKWELMMRTHGDGEGNITHWEPIGG